MGEIAPIMGRVWGGVECWGEGAASRSSGDRATISNMCPEYGATAAMCSIDDQTLAYLDQLLARLGVITTIIQVNTFHATLDFFHSFSARSPCVLSRSLLQLLYTPLNYSLPSRPTGVSPAPGPPLPPALSALAAAAFTASSLLAASASPLVSERDISPETRPDQARPRPGGPPRGVRTRVWASQPRLAPGPESCGRARPGLAGGPGASAWSMRTSSWT